MPYITYPTQLGALAGFGGEMEILVGTALLDPCSGQRQPTVIGQGHLVLTTLGTGRPNVSTTVEKLVHSGSSRSRSVSQAGGVPDSRLQPHLDDDTREP